MNGCRDRPTLRESQMAVIVGTIARVDEARGLVFIGNTELRVPGNLALDAIGPGVSVTVTCEERDGQYWIRAIRANLF
jgi:hypothetical protein